MESETIDVDEGERFKNLSKYIFIFQIFIIFAAILDQIIFKDLTSFPLFCGSFLLESFFYFIYYAKQHDKFECEIFTPFFLLCFQFGSFITLFVLYEILFLYWSSGSFCELKQTFILNMLVYLTSFFQVILFSVRLLFSD